MISNSKTGDVFCVVTTEFLYNTYLYRGITKCYDIQLIDLHVSTTVLFGGLGVACWPLVPKFAGSNPAEAVGFLGAKKSSARLPSEGK